MQLWCNQKQWEGATNYERSKIHKIHRLEPQISHGLLSCYFFKRWWTFNLRENLNPTEMNMFYPLKSHIPVFFLDQQPPLGASMLWKLSWNLGHCGIWSARVYPCSSISKKKHEHLDLGMSQNLKIVDPPFGMVLNTASIGSHDGHGRSLLVQLMDGGEDVTSSTTHGCGHSKFLSQERTAHGTSRVGPWHLHQESPAVFFQPRLGKKEGNDGKETWRNYETLSTP